MTMPAVADITFQIEELVLEGVARSDWRRIEDALRRELERLVDRDGVPQQGGGATAVEELDLGDLDVQPGMRPGEIGRRLARALYDELSGGL